MATRTATLTVSLSTNPATAHIGPFFADLRINGRQITTRVGTAKMIGDFVNYAHVSAMCNGMLMTVIDETYKNNFTGRGGLIDTPYSD